MLRFRQKIYLAILPLFVLCFVGSVIYMVRTSYDMILKREREMVISNAYLLQYSIEADFASFYRYNTLGSDNKRRLFLEYSFLYQRKDIYLQLIEDGQVVYNSFPNEEYALDWSQAQDYEAVESEGKIMVFTTNGQTYMAVKNNMDGIFSNMDLVYIMSLGGLEKHTRQLVNSFIVTGSLLLFFLMGNLYVVIKKMTKSLGKLSEAASAMSGGQYERRIEINGRDEIAEVAEQFNAMATEIDKTINILEGEDVKKQRFIDDLGHELRTPLTTVSGYAEYLLMANVSEEEKIRILEYMIAESRRLQKLSATLLQLTSLRTDAIEKNWVLIATFTERAVQNVKMKYAEKNIVYKATVEVEKIYGNEELLESLLTNLLENAARACGVNGRVSVCWQSVGIMQDIKLVVQDDGVGMLEEEIQKIQEPFYRVDKARSRKSGGIGLGMSLCMEILKCHNGTLSCKSVYGQGTEMEIIFTS